MFENLHRAAVLGLSLTASAAFAADYPPAPDYPLNPVEQLYDDLAKLPTAERAAKILDGAKKEGKLAIIQAFGGTLGRGHTKIFTDAYPFVAVEESLLGTDDGVSRMVAEERAGRHLTDLAASMGIPEINGLIDSKIAARFKTPATDKVLPQYRSFMDPFNRYTLSHWSENGISYNTDMIKPEDAPKSHQDLCNPKYKGTVSFEPVRSRIVAFFHKIMGEEGYVKWLDCMSKNQPLLMDGYSNRMNLMLTGDHAIQGENFWYTGYTAKQKNAKTPFAPVLEAELLGNGGAVVINRFTPHPYAAALFADWVLTEPPQKYMAEQLRGPVVLKHPFLPENVKLVTMGMVETKENERLMDLWKKYMSSGKR
jgi:iron(III) transport system substrate-binding protein